MEGSDERFQLLEAELASDPQIFTSLDTLNDDEKHAIEQFQNHMRSVDGVPMSGSERTTWLGEVITPELISTASRQVFCVGAQVQDLGGDPTRSEEMEVAVAKELLSVIDMIERGRPVGPIVAHHVDLPSAATSPVLVRSVSLRWVIPDDDKII